MTAIYAIGARRTNAEALHDAHLLGYVPGPVLDPTFGKGAFWRGNERPDLVASDLHGPAPGASVPSWVRCALGVDFRSLPHADGAFASLLFDPPYKLNGTSTGAGPSASDEHYGVGASAGYQGWRAKHDLINAGIVECARVVERRGYLLVKCQDQVCGGHVRWQTREFADTAEAAGCRLVDRLLVRGVRAQPESRPCSLCGGAGGVDRPGEVLRWVSCTTCGGSGRVAVVQRRVHADFSTLLVFRKGVR